MPWRFQLVCDPDGLRGRLLIPALAEHQCRAGEQPLFRLALAGQHVEAAAFLQAEANVEGPPLVVCAPTQAAEELVRRLPGGTEIFTAEDGAALLAALESLRQSLQAVGEAEPCGGAEIRCRRRAVRRL